MVPVSPEYAEKLDRMMRADLDFWSAYWFWFLIKSTVAVVFGLLAELPEVWSEVIRPIWTWGRNVWRTKVRNIEFSGWEAVCPELATVTQNELSHRQKVVIGALALLGWMLVAVGVAGEGIGEYFVNDAETNLRNFDDAVLADTQKAAGLAATSAKTARAEADAATQAALEVQARVKTVGKRAEDIDADLAQTQYLMSARSITDMDSLVKQLKQYKGQLVHLGSYINEPEITGLCNALLFATHKAEMNALDECGRSEAVGSPSTGVIISGPDIQQTMDLAQVLSHTVNLGPGGTISGIKASALSIFVGVRPPFMIGQARGVKVVPTKKQTKQNGKP